MLIEGYVRPDRNWLRVFVRGLLTVLASCRWWLRCALISRHIIEIKVWISICHLIIIHASTISLRYFPLFERWWLQIECVDEIQRVLAHCTWFIVIEAWQWFWGWYGCHHIWLDVEFLRSEKLVIKTQALAELQFGLSKRWEVLML